MARFIVFSLVLLQLCSSSVPFAEEEVTANPMPYNLSNYVATSDGFTADVTYTGTSTSTAVIKNLSLTVKKLAGAQIRVTLLDKDNTRWQVPFVTDNMNPDTSVADMFNIAYTETPFSLTISRKSDNVVIFNIASSVLFQYNDQYLIVANTLGYNVNIYGLGERVTDFRLKAGTYAMWSLDNASPIDDGASAEKNMYSVHPFYLAADGQGKAFGVLFLNSNAQAATVADQSVTFRSTGGVMDFFVFAGPDAESVVKQYHQIIGQPVLIPYWSLGWHQSKYGYHDLDDWKEVLRNYMNLDIPLDGLWTDIDYMNSYFDFTMDDTRYPKADRQAFLAYLRNNLKKHFVPIIDAGLGQNTKQPGFDEGTSKGLFIQSANHSGAAVGQVWPGDAVYMDWFHPDAETFWLEQFDTFTTQVIDIDGVWLDMNEASNFCNGECGYNPTITPSTMPYTPFNFDLNTKSMDLAAKHYTANPDQQNLYTEYNIHSLYGFLESKVTSKFFSETKKTRPFIISRSSFPGHGYYASKWLGDNHSRWEFIEYSIGGIMNFNIFGIPMIGSDICGFLEDTNAELCARWSQVGTLYPFSRNHNDIHAIPQEPWRFDVDTMNTISDSIRVKYGLMLFYYTHMFNLSLNGGTFFKPAFFNYPTDSKLYDTHATDNFMLGTELIVHPVLAAGQSSVQGYFPNDIWYDYFYGNQITLLNDGYAYLKSELPGLINVHIRGGAIVPRLDNWYKALNVIDLRSGGYTLIIANDANKSAKGQVVFDDGESVGTIKDKKYTLMNYSWSASDKTNQVLSITAANKGYTKPSTEFPYISTLLIYGCTKEPLSVSQTVSGQTTSVSAELDYDNIPKTCMITFNSGIPTDQEMTLTVAFAA